MFTWRDLLVEEERRRQELATASERRMQASLLAPPPSRLTRLQQVRVALGCRLISWGEQLQAPALLAQPEPVVPQRRLEGSGC